jgi:hypothetical protein
MRLRLAIICGLLLLPGCMVIRVTARNPIPDMTTIAVAPFFNLTQEPNSVVDGRRFALAYYSELQKTQGFEVIPVGVVEATILEHRLELQNPHDALKLCELLNADAVVIGAVTDYEAYYPPRIGMQVDWYSPYEWTSPITSAGLLDGGVQVRGMGRMRGGRSARRCKPVKYRGQSPDGSFRETLPPPSSEADLLDPPSYNADGSAGPGHVPPLPVDLGGDESELSGQGAEPAVPNLGIPTDAGLPGPPQPGLGGEGGILEERLPPPVEVPNVETAPSPEDPEGMGPSLDREPAANSADYGAPPDARSSSEASSSEVEFDPTQPLMSYTRMFDGAETELVNKLRDYLELRGDRRSGSWEEYLHRSEDFIRFVSHVMIVEMLSVHGGANRTQIVFKWRKYR